MRIAGGRFIICLVSREIRIGIIIAIFCIEDGPDERMGKTLQVYLEQLGWKFNGFRDRAKK